MKDWTRAETTKASLSKHFSKAQLFYTLVKRRGAAWSWVVMNYGRTSTLAQGTAPTQAVGAARAKEARERMQAA